MILALIVATLACAGEKSAGTLDPIPETIVQISVFDFGQLRKLGAPKLPADYGQRVAEIIAKRKPALLECLARFSLDHASWKVRLDVQSGGKGKVEFTDDVADRKDVSVCVQNTLSEIQYPKHPMRHSVSVSFPLTLARRTL